MRYNSPVSICRFKNFSGVIPRHPLIGEGRGGEGRRGKGRGGEGKDGREGRGMKGRGEEKEGEGGGWKGREGGMLRIATKGDGRPCLART
jgi:hypothetical protein